MDVQHFSTLAMKKPFEGNAIYNPLTKEHTFEKSASYNCIKIMKTTAQKRTRKFPDDIFMYNYDYFNRKS